MQGKEQTIYVGIDVSRARLDVHLHPSDERFAVGNDAAGRRQLVRRLRQLGIALVAIEPTGTFHRALHRHLHAAGLATALVDPLRARRFAQAIGQLAKNDRIDAAMLALMAERLSPAPTAPPDPAQEHLA
ncbi:MAG: transposase [Sphingomonas fennica]